MDFEEYRAHDATSLAKLVADGEVSAAELLTLARERAAAVNPRINAVVRDVPAVPADRPQGPFSGVPFLIKDLAQDYAGLQQGLCGILRDCRLSALSLSMIMGS